MHRAAGLKLLRRAPVAAEGAGRALVSTATERPLLPVLVADLVDDREALRAAPELDRPFASATVLWGGPNAG